MLMVISGTLNTYTMYACRFWHEYIERLTISRHVTLCYQLSTLVCLVLFCCCLLHCDKIHVSPVCETMRCKVFYTKQRKHNYLCHIEGAVMAHRLTYDDHRGTHQSFDVKRNCSETNIRVRPPYMLWALRWNEMLVFRSLLCTLFRLNWAKQTPGIMRRN